jgi:hypothetical protein
MKERHYSPAWVGIFILAVLTGFYIYFQLQNDALENKVNQLKQSLTGPEKNDSWNGGHASVAVTKHSPNCECLK